MTSPRTAKSCFGGLDSVAKGCQPLDGNRLNPMGDPRLHNCPRNSAKITGAPAQLVAASVSHGYHLPELGKRRVRRCGHTKERIKPAWADIPYRGGGDMIGTGFFSAAVCKTQVIVELSHEDWTVGTAGRD